MNSDTMIMSAPSRNTARRPQYSNREVREKSLYSLADCLFRIGKIDEAREVWMRQVDGVPGRAAMCRLAYYRLGTTAFSKGELEKAEAFYRKTLENNRTRSSRSRPSSPLPAVLRQATI